MNAQHDVLARVPGEELPAWLSTTLLFTGVVGAFAVCHLWLAYGGLAAALTAPPRSESTEPANSRALHGRSVAQSPQPTIAATPTSPTNAPVGASSTAPIAPIARAALASDPTTATPSGAAANKQSDARVTRNNTSAAISPCTAIIIAFHRTDRTPPASAAAAMPALVKLHRAHPESRITIRAYSNETGGPAIVLRLAKARADRVAALLLAAGLPPNALTREPVPDAAPPANDVINSLGNRRADIIFSNAPCPHPSEVITP